MTDQIDQRTDDWMTWRNKGLGASDAPIIMGVSPWKTYHQLWELKTGRAKPDEGNWATRRGNDLEPKARAMLEITSGLEFPAMLAEHPEIPWLRASLDGWNVAGKIVLEIKCPGAEDHQKAKAGTVPEKYIPQLQHQLIVTGGVEAWYYSYHESDGQVDTALVIVEPDREYMTKLFRELAAFWKLVETDEEPPLTDRDFVMIRSKELRAKFEEWGDAKAKSDYWLTQNVKLRNEILAHEKVVGRRVRCDKYRTDKLDDGSFFITIQKDESAP